MGASYFPTLQMLMLGGKKKVVQQQQKNKMASSSEDNILSYHNMSAFSYRKTVAKEHSILRQFIVFWDN
jgi:hypothetical protein